MTVTAPDVLPGTAPDVLPGTAPDVLPGTARRPSMRSRVVAIAVAAITVSASGQLGWIHAGLGPSERAEVRVQWPDGEIGPWLHVDADGFYVIERGAGDARPWTPGQD